MSDDLDAMVRDIRRNPKDPLTIQVLADALEDMGANGASVRDLTIDGPTILVFSFPADWDDEDKQQAVKNAAETGEFIKRETGHNIRVICMVNTMTIRQIKLTQKETT